MSALPLDIPPKDMPGPAAPERPRVRRRRRLAAALRYVAGDSRLPVVVAAGGGAIADRLLESAREADLPVTTDADLAQTLARLDLGGTIPPEAVRFVQPDFLDPVLAYCRGVVFVVLCGFEMAIVFEQSEVALLGQVLRL